MAASRKPVARPSGPAAGPAPAPDGAGADEAEDGADEPEDKGVVVVPGVEVIGGGLSVSGTWGGGGRGRTRVRGAGAGPVRTATGITVRSGPVHCQGAARVGGEGGEGARPGPGGSGRPPRERPGTVRGPMRQN
ncbi:hypothetical protein Sgou_29620 [Streptomyces gougerotii]|uniref:Uncharacterized protein n=1 Tax=Streptomyces gougerotii TaxID=53448 RepID=A0A8H9HMC4_9ACTN|nr:hypothetical protein Sgou_29620 [Streptomyces gougerotii]GGU69934.1 hypothetical protein GCM10010227_24840 [Streptomyces gougerotii]